VLQDGKMTIYIKNMVCSRCKMVVKTTFEKLGLHPVQVELGEVTLQENDISVIKEQLKQELQFFGFDLLDNKKTKTIEKIKNRIIDLVQNKNNNLQVTLSDYLIQELHQDYSMLSNLFSQVEGITIEKYYIFQKIEKVKELLVYDELSLSEIAFQLNYSSVAYLSNQFKKVTGLTPSHFKSMQTIKRKSIEEL
jgi:AraC-like DNA-binding protein|tara:strand:- start:24642 stop:25220 length:579 start_codon:yes stop_codon:yes gene_type:complete